MDKRKFKRLAKKSLDVGFGEGIMKDSKDEEVTMKNLKDKLYEWKCSKSIELAYNICSALCDYFGIVRGGDSDLEID